ncbi:hypothetical protein J4480_04550 [Candidatus Woesearchaeota archaeon]|nr:hypothetical protein [Candidatus Woesearchaeota archaeon]
MSVVHPMHRGPFLRYFLEVEPSFASPMEWILASNDIEVYYVPKMGQRTDPEFYMATKDGVLIKFAFTGDMTGIYKLLKSEKGSSVDTVVEMDPKHRFHLDRGSLPVNGVVDDKAKSGDQILESLVNYAYSKAKSVENPNARGMARNFQVLTYDAIVSRFKMLEAMQSSTDIIPDQSPRTIFIKAGDGCVMECNYCPEGLVRFKPYSMTQFLEHIQNTKSALTDILGKEGITKMNEGFINVSDIGWLDLFHRTGRTDLTSVEAVRLMREYFPWLEKIGTFIGSSTALALSEGTDGIRYVGSKRYNTRFFETLNGKGNLINRLYLGVETAHTEGSYLLNKRINYWQKLTATKLIQDSGIRLKVIVQLGVLGKGFYPLGKEITPENFVTWEEATDITAGWINEVQPYRVLESVYQPSPELPINRLIKDGRIVPYDNPEQIEQERKRLRENIRIFKNEFKVEPRYEDFLPKKGGQVIEYRKK